MNDVEAGQTHSGFLPLVSAMFLMSFSSFMLMGALPKSLLDNGAGALAIGVVMGGFGVSAALSRLFLGPAIDRLPYRLSLGLPALTLGATWLAAAFLPVGTALLVPRALQGAAVGYFNAAAFAWIAKNIAASASNTVTVTFAACPPKRAY